ncbi:MAG: hypothetical protein NC127_02370 [Muribaculum sp.]|nr:hypothetical protein [Muribaculum sp.]
MNSNILKIKRLLSLYDSGLSSLSDEIELRRLLLETRQLPKELADSADIVLSLSSKPAVDVPSGLQNMLSADIDRLAHKEKVSKRGNRWIAIAGIAASVTIVASVAAFLLTEKRHNPYEITDPVEASRMSIEAIRTVAQGLKDADNAAKESYKILNSILSKELLDSIDIDTLEQDTMSGENEGLSVVPDNQSSTTQI